ncbi:MAG: ATP-binding protein [Rhodocyclaceae bacterium]|nr:ATP-binding protein [Rhodocyclaceae bacterium]
MNAPMSLPPERPFRLFLSYAHSNEACKDRLKKNLAPLARNGWLKVWDDRLIPAGSDWRAEIEGAMAASDAAALLLDDDFLASSFCMDVEVASFLQHHRDKGTLILFILADYCLWEECDFIRQFQLLPRDAKPIVAFDPPSLAYTAIAREIKAALAEHKLKPLPAEHLGPGATLRHLVAPIKAGLGTLSEALTYPILAAPAAIEPVGPPMDLTVVVGRVSTRQAVPAPLSLPALLEKLPGRTEHLFGREGELAQLDEWREHKGVFLWVAQGGMGKSALVRAWLEWKHEQNPWPAGTRFLGHSFYSQGSHNQATSGRGFLLEALKQLGVAHATDAPDDELGRLLAEEAAKGPMVLVLDGMEPLQQASLDPMLNGSVKDRGLAALLENLARKPGAALCLASSRLPIPDIGIRDAAWFREKELGSLPPAGALALLRSRGLKGADEELANVAQRCGHHALALVLAAEFCHTYLKDEAAEFLKRPWRPQAGETHATTVMAWFDEALKEEHLPLDRELVQVLGLFDRPAPWGALLALKACEPPIPGLTEALHGAGEADLLESLARLSQWGLLQSDLTQAQPELDAHPLVREHFGRQLAEQNPDAWRAAHAVLFDWFRNLPEKEFPDTLEELEPLYRAVGHGCKAGRYRTALYGVYIERILRGNQRYDQFQLGAWSSDLAALAGFFPEGWDHEPVSKEAGLSGEQLSEANRSWLLAEAAFCLTSLGRLEEALVPRRIGRQRENDSGDWNEYCRSSENFVDLLTPLGRWQEAEQVSREAEQAAERIKDGEKRWWRSREAFAYLGKCLQGQGRLSEAGAAFAQAEAGQAQTPSHELRLCSLPGYGYCQLLLEQTCQLADWREVLERGRDGLKADSLNNHLLSLALHRCTIGLALAALGDSGAGSALDSAVSTMQRAGNIELLPPMYLARANYLRSQGDLVGAWSDHDAAFSISRRGNMRAYLAECALLAGNLCLDENRLTEAAGHYAEAARLIREDGYGRRLTELHLLQARLLRAQHDPAAQSALTQAEARIRDIGQWGFWRELRAVAAEIKAADPGECPTAG